MQSPQQGVRYVFPGLGGLYQHCEKYAWALLRIGYGLWYVPHGAQKLFGMFGGNIAGVAKGMEAAGISPGMFWAYYIGVLEFAGGILLAIGLFTRPVALLFAGFTAVATFYFNWRYGYFWTKGGLEMPLLLLWIAIVILIRGGGEYSVDRRIGREV
jgi:putative oxidoreductase